MYWLGVAAGIQRYAYIWNRGNGTAGWFVGPHATTTLEEAMKAVQEEAHQAMKACEGKEQDGK